ncbi:MAG: 4Fe-4S binding protein [Spirochaetes bacterium]|nr:4Fe-4S binding protein [Spirochaetota bacterium]HPA72917.1 4Fe-4S binding protein [Spirochaetota bacterium]
MKKPARMTGELVKSVFKRPATTRYPYVKGDSSTGFRGKILFTSEKCVGCKLCMRDCPAGAITITKVGEKLFECDIDMANCIFCGQCVDSCLKDALALSEEFENAGLDEKSLMVHFRAKPKDGPESQS